MEDHQTSSGTGAGGGIRRAGFAVLGALAVLVVTGCATNVPPPPPTTVPPPGPGPATVGSAALGVNLTSWDPLTTGTGAPFVDALISSAGLRQLRYPGGSFADEFDWSTTTDSATCHGAVTTACSRPDPFGFDRFAAQAERAGASTFLTVNYGSGTPAEAGQWAAHAAALSGPGPTLWEVGNESYSCYETNDHLAGRPTFVRGFTPGGPHCPSTEQMARSYAADAPPYLAAIEQADPGTRIGVPWAFTGSVAAGAGVSDADAWNREVLHALGPKVGFVDAHWYPFDSIQGVSAGRILASVRTIPAAAAHIRATLHHYAPDAGFTVGETNISERPTVADFGPVSALFAAATSLEWLAAGAAGVDWWDLNNYGSPATGDFGLVSSGSPETESAGTPFPPYYGEVLASMLTSPGSRLRGTAPYPARRSASCRTGMADARSSWSTPIPTTGRWSPRHGSHPDGRCRSRPTARPRPATPSPSSAPRPRGRPGWPSLPSRSWSSRDWPDRRSRDPSRLSPGITGPGRTPRRRRRGW